MATEYLYMKCENEDCGNMKLYKRFDLDSNGSRRGEPTVYESPDNEWGSYNQWRCPSCGTGATLTRRVS